MSTLGVASAYVMSSGESRGYQDFALAKKQTILQ